MEEMKKSKKRPKGISKKAQRVRSIIMMSLLCVLLLSAATYAWFTLSNTAKVSNLSLTVGDVTGLQICKTADGTFGSTLEFDKFKGTLLPATTTNGVNMLKPEYGDAGSVTGTKSTTTKLDSSSVDATEGYYYETTFYMKSLGAASTVKLVKAEGIPADGIFVGASEANYKGTYMLSKTATSAVPATAAMRISFTVGGTTTVYEPYSDITTTTANKATDERASKDCVASTVQQVAAGTLTDAGVISLPADTATAVTVRIWFEGTDAQCVNEIAAKDIVGQLQFTNAKSE